MSFFAKNDRWDLAFSLTALLILIVGALGFFGLVIFLKYRSVTLFYKNPTNVVWLEKIATPIIWLECLAAAIMVFTVVAVLLSSRWRTPRLFISYHAEDFELAKQMADSLQRHRLIVYIDTPGSVDHDAVLSRLRNQLNACHAVLLVPGHERSFVDAEAFAASLAKKPIIITAATADDTLPDTVFLGYPVFSLNRLAQADFKPLVEFVMFQFMYWRDSLSTLGEAINRPLEAYARISMAPAIILGLISWINYRWYLFIARPLIWIVFPFVLGSFVILVIYGLYVRLKTASIARQRIITGASTAALLEDILPARLQHVANYMSSEPLKLRHVPQDVTHEF